MHNVRTPALNAAPITEALDDRVIALMRLILAAAALLSVAIDPSALHRIVVVTYAAYATFLVRARAP